MRKKTSLLLILCLLLFIILAGTYAYSRYTSAAMIEKDIRVAVWNIKVNGCSIVDPSSNLESIAEECFKTEVIDESGTVGIVKNFRVTKDNISYYPLENDGLVNSNKIAPGTEARFNIEIDPFITEAAFKYTLNNRYNGENNHIKFYIVETDKNFNPILDENGQEKTYSINGQGYTNTIYYSSNPAENEDRRHFLQVKVVWEDDKSGATDKIDTEMGTSTSSPILQVPITILFEQITSEIEEQVNSEPTSPEEGNESELSE